MASEQEVDRVIRERVDRMRTAPVIIPNPPRAGHQRKCRECGHHPQHCERACHPLPCTDGERQWDGFTGNLVPLVAKEEVP